MGSAPRSQVEAVDAILRDRQTTLQQLKSNLAKAQNMMKQQADNNRSEQHFLVGDWVYLKLQPYHQITVTGFQNKKLSPKYYGSYKLIRKVGVVAYHLNLPAGSTIHLVFHVSQLKKRIRDSQATFPNLPVIGSNGTLQAILVALLARCMVKKCNAAVSQVLIQWLNQSSEDATWEDYESIARQFPEFVLEVENALEEERMSQMAELVTIRSNFVSVITSKENTGLERAKRRVHRVEKLKGRSRCKRSPHVLKWQTKIH